MRWLLPLVLVTGCVGPPAPDVELCRDIITRVCLGPVCESAKSILSVDETCEATLLARTGCGAEEFGFATPTRNRVLECRLPLVRTSTSRAVKASCDDVSEMLSTCPDLVLFLKGMK